MLFRNLDAFGSHHQYSAKPALVPFSLFLQKRILNHWLQNYSACATILASTMDGPPYLPPSVLQTHAFQHPFLALGSRYTEAFALTKMCWVTSNICAFAPIVPLPEIALFPPQCIHLMKTYSSLIYEAFPEFLWYNWSFVHLWPHHALQQFRTYFLLQHYELLKGKEHVFSSLSPQCPAHSKWLN